MVWDETTPLSVDNLNNLEIRISAASTSVTDGKTAIAAAITDKGIPSAVTDTFAEMASKISQISGVISGVQDSSGNDVFYHADGTTTSVALASVIVSGLGFTPSKIIMQAQGYGALAFYNADAPISPSYPNGKIALAKTFFGAENGSGTLQNIKLDGVKAYVNSNGFKLPVPVGGYKYYWWAFK